MKEPGEQPCHITFFWALASNCSCEIELKERRKKIVANALLSLFLLLHFTHSLLCILLIYSSDKNPLLEGEIAEVCQDSFVSREKIPTNRKNIIAQVCAERKFRRIFARYLSLLTGTLNGGRKREKRIRREKSSSGWRK